MWLGVPWLMATAGCGGSYQKHLDAGFADLARTNYVDAARHFERVAQRQPPQSTAFYNLGLAYWKLGYTDQAVDALTMAGDLEHNDPRPMLLLTEVLQDAKRWDEARKVLTTISNGLPERPDLVTRLARLEYRAGNAEQAATYLDNALQLDPSYPPALYNMAVLARDQQKDALTAMRFFSRFLAVSTDQARIDRVHEELARLRQPFRPKPPAPPRPTTMVSGAEAPPPAVPVAPAPGPAPVLAPVSDAAMAVTLLEQARASLGAEAYDEALVLLGQARARDPRNADVLWTTAGLYDQQLGQPQKAESILREFVRLFPQDVRVLAAQRRLGLVAGHGATASPPSPPPPTTTVLITRSVQSPPPTPSTAPSRAQATARQSSQTVWRQALDAHAAGQWAEAIRLYETVLTLDPRFASAAFNLGVAYKSQGNVPYAQAAFSRATAIDPRMAKAHYMLAVVYREQGDRTSAIDSAKRALGVDPNDDKTHYLLGLLYRDSMRYDLARYHFKRAVELAPDRATADKARTALASMPTPGAKR